MANVLVGCERSGAVREALRARGINAWSNDLVPADDGSPYHLIGDVLGWLDAVFDDGTGWDGLIVFPDCTFLTGAGLHWNKRRPGRAVQTEEALTFVRALLESGIPKIALENPIGCIGTRIRKPTQIIQPYQFGDDASKATCLWLVNLPALIPTRYVPPRMVNGRPRWGNQTDSGQNRLGPKFGPNGENLRAIERARTYPGIADAMAERWAPCFG